MIQDLIWALIGYPTALTLLFIAHEEAFGSMIDSMLTLTALLLVVFISYKIRPKMKNSITS